MGEVHRIADADASSGPFRSDEAFVDAERRVMHPETDTRTVRFGESTLKLRPLPLGAAKRVALIAEKAFAQVTANGAAGAASEIGDALIDAMVVIGELYKIPGITRLWVEENLDDGDAFDVLEAQLAVGSRNSFLRRGVLPILKLVRETFAGLESIDPTAVKQQVALAFASPEKPASSPASARPGESPSPSSSSDTPRDS